MSRPGNDDEATLRTLRAESNTAIARRDVDALLSVLRDDVRVITSDVQLCDGKESMGRYFRKAFAQSRLLMVVRHAERFTLGGAIAAEEGCWEAHWSPDRVFGKYLARWERGPLGWRTVAELFVPLERRRLPE